MTEQEWLTGGRPNAILVPVRGRSSDRKLRLFFAACCRRIWPLLMDERSRRAVEVTERYADGRAEQAEMDEACILADEFYRALLRAPIRADTDEQYWAAYYARHAASMAASAVVWAHYLGDLVPVVSLGCCEAVASADGSPGGQDSPAWQAEYAAQTYLLRDICGNPYRPVVAPPAGRTLTISQLAEAAYAERQLPSGHLGPARLAVLADALEAAGATGEIVAHLRGPGPHVRGCWALDLLLGKD